jgi:hypothetical protein
VDRPCVLQCPSKPGASFGRFLRARSVGCDVRTAGDIDQKLRNASGVMPKVSKLRRDMNMSETCFALHDVRT